ncbi:MAG: efflux transporter outer membrane subunit [Kiritimatiellae bacterium]|nr:efflux transporter outer membrane subunit [Kiritimatiellia bacterium]
MKFLSISKCLFAAAAPALLAGCISLGPDFKAPEWDGPEAWAGDTASTAVLPDGAPWWSVFNDPVLDSLEASLLAQNPSLAAAVARLDASAAQFGIARGTYAPSLGLSASANYDRQTGEVRAHAEYPHNPDWLFTPGAAFQWELDFWGRVRRNVEAASADFSAAAQDVASARLLLSSRLASTYVSLRALQSRLDYARRNADLQAGTLELVQSRCDAGLVGELDLRQAEMNLAATRARIPALEAQIDASILAISALVGEWPGALPALRDPAPVPLPDDAALPSSLPADLLRNRPDVAAAIYRLHAATARIGAAKAEMFPKISFNGSFAFAATDTSVLFKENAQNYSIGPVVEWPIFTAGRLRNQVRAQEAAARAAEADFRETVLSAAAECETALSSHRAANAVLGDLRAAVAAAEQSADLADSLYRNGLTDFQNVLDMQRQLASHQDSLAQGLGSAASALVDVWKSFAAPCTPLPSEADETADTDASMAPENATTPEGAEEEIL